MAVELVDSYVRRDGIEDDTAFLIAQFKKALSELEKLDKAKIDLKAAKSFTAAGEAAGKMKVQLDELQKIESSLIKVYEQRQAATSKQAKDLAAEKEALRQKNTELKNTVREQSAAVGSIEQMRAALIRLNKEYDNLSASDRNAAGGQQLRQQIKALSDELKELESNTGRNQRNVGNYSQALKTLEKAVGDAKGKLDLLTRSGLENTEAFELAQKEYATLNSVISNQANGFATMREEIKANQAAIEQLSVVYGEDAQIVRDLIAENGALRDSFDDLVATQKTLGSDTFAFDALLEGGQALVGMYSAAQGAAALFGEDNEELEKTMVKLQASMALVQGVQATVNALQKEGALIQGIAAARTTVMTLAQRAYAFATGGATVAARTFNTVLLTSGIGAAIALIATAASAMSSFGDETEGSTQSLEDFNSELQFTNQLLDQQIDSINNANDILIERIKQRGGTETEINNQSVDGLKKVKQAYLDNADVLQDKFDNLSLVPNRSKEDTEKLLKLQDEITASKQKAIGVDTKITLENERLKTKIAEDGRNKAKKDAEERLQLQKQYAEKERRAAFELVKLGIQERIDYEKEQSTSGLVGLDGRLVARANAFEEEKKLIEAERKFALASDNLTASERELVNKEAAKKLLDAEKQTGLDLIQIRNDFRAQQQEIEEKNKALADEFINAETDRQINALSSGFDKRIAQLEEQALKEQEINQAAFIAGKITKEQYEAEKLAIENKFRRESLLAEIANTEEMLQIMTLSPEQAADGEQKLAELKRKLRSEDLKDAEDKAAAQLELEKKKNDALKELANEVKETAFELFTNNFENEKNAIQDQINLIDERKAKEIEAANQSIANAQERAAAISIIEARSAAEKEGLERRKRQLDEQRARFEKFKNIAEIIGNTARGIAAALPNIPLSIIVGAIGAAQLVRAIAAPIPRFFKGKNLGSAQASDSYEGMAWVDDGGKPEAIIREDGSVEIGTAKPRLTYLKKNDIVLPDAKQLQDLSLRMAIDQSGKLVNGYQPPAPKSDNVEREIKRMRHDVVEAVKSIPTPIIKNGVVENWVRGRGSITELNRYR